MDTNHKATILLVDDQPAKLLSYETILSGLGADLIMANSGREALEYLLKRDVAVILLDVCMPELDGFELAKTIRQHHRFQKTAIILASAIQMTDLDRLRGYDCGAVDYISVPVIPELLRAKVSVFADLYRKTHELERLNLELELRVAERTSALEASTLQLRQNEERLKLAVEGAKMGTWDEDLQTGKVFWSAAHFRMLGYETDSDAEASVEMTRSRIHPDDLKHVMETIERSRNEQSLYSCEYRVSRANDGVTIWLSAFGRFFYDEYGVATRFVGILINITERKQDELARAELLARERAARRKEEEANRAKDEFLAMLSHELRTPLNVVFGWTRLLRSGKLDEKASAQALEVIERNATLQNQLLADLLDVSRVITGKLQLDVRPVEVVNIVQEAVNAMKPGAIAKGISLESEADSNIGPILADPDRLRQIVWNLLSNAVKFTPEGGRVRVQLMRVHSSIKINISDTGEGIQPEFLPFIFDRFSQADSSITRKHRGLGLGLSIVRHLVELHGGTVRAESHGEGQGSTFSVELPLKMSRDQQQSMTEMLYGRKILVDLPSRPLTALPALDRVHVLVVEDEADACNMLATALQQSGAQVRAAASAREAMAIFEEWKPDVLVADIGMPEENGYTLIRKVRALSVEQGGAIPAVALTAFARSEDRMRSLSEGFQIHVSKPVDPSELVVLLYNLTRKSQTA